eukprot:EG_transcript_250
MRVLALLSAVVLLLGCPSSHADAAGPLGQNLLADPSGEDPTSPAWTVPGGGPPLRVNGSLVPRGAVDGQLVLSGPGVPVSQNVSVAGYPVGTPFLFTAFLSSLNFETEKGQVLLQWLDSTGAVLFNVSSPVWPTGFPDADAQRWYRYTASLAKPAGAVGLRVSLLTLGYTFGQAPEMFYDALHLAADNLLVNPSGEYVAGAINPTLDGWTATPSPTAPLGAFAPPWGRLSWYRTLMPQDGRYFFAPPANTSEAYLFQDVGVAAYPAGTPFFLEVYAAAAVAGTSSDVTALMLQWRTANGTVLAADALPDQSVSSLAWGVRRLWPVKRDAGAAVCRVLLVAKRRRWIQDGYDNRAFFDSVFFGPADQRAIVTPATLALGPVHTSDPGQRTITVLNAGVINTLTVLAVSLSQPAGPSSLSLTGPNGTAIAPLANQTWILRFDTSTAATWTGTVTFALNDPQQPQVSLPVFIQIFLATLDISPSSFDFGTQHISAGDQLTTIFLYNTGSAPVAFSGIQTNFSLAFEVQGVPAAAVMQPGEAFSFNLIFHPSLAAPGPNRAAFAIASSDISKANFSFVAQAVVEDYRPGLSSPVLDFGQRHVLLGPKALQLTLNNSGTYGVLQVLSIQFIQTNTAQEVAQYSVDSTRARNLRPNVTATWTVTFNPSANGAAFGEANCYLQLLMNYPPNTVLQISLHAVGSDQSVYANPSALVLSSSHIYGGLSPTVEGLHIGAAGTQGTLTVQNLSLVGLGGRPPSFVLSFDPSQSPIVVGGAAVVNLQFNPGLDAAGTPGWRNATLLVSTDDPSTPVLAVPLAAIALDYTIALQASTFDFGEQHIAVPQRAAAFRVRNTGSFGSLVLSGVTVAPGNSGFSSSAGQLTVPAGGAVNVTLFFRPPTVGPKASALVVSSNDPVSPTVQCNLTGIGVDPQPVFVLPPDQTEVVFPNVQDTDAPPSAPMAVLLNNTGTFGNMVVTDFAIQGSNGYDFQVVSADASPLAPGYSRNWTVRFAPNETGALQGTLWLQTRTGQTAQVPLLGTAVHPKISLSATAISFGQWDILAGAWLNSAIGQPFFQLVITNVGSTDLVISSHRLLVNPGLSYYLADTLEGVAIPAQTQQVLNVAWDPNNPNGRQQGLLSITSNDYLNPVVNVTLQGQAIEQLGVNASIIGNVSFQPPFAGQAATVRIFVYTSDAGLPMDGAVQAILPAGFDLSAATAHIGQTFFDRSRLQIIGTQVTINVAGSGLPSVQKGGLLQLYLHDVVLPPYAACQASYLDWQWTVTTYDARGGLLEFALNATLPGVVCVAPKTYTMRTTPVLPAAPAGLQAGYHVQFTITVQDPASLLAAGAPLLDTRPGRDTVKTIAAFKGSYPQYCSGQAAAEGGLIAWSDNLGDLDAVAQVNATFRTTFLPGTWRLCYRQAFGGFGWEQVGDPFAVSDKIPSHVALDFPIPMPPSMQTDWWASGQPPWVAEDNMVMVGEVQPLRVVANETVRYRFSGAFFNGGRSLWAKVAYQVRGCGGTAPGTPPAGVPLQNNLAAFAVAQPSLYTVCIQERAPYWYPLADLWVRTVEDADPPSTDRPFFSGFQTCGEYTRYFPTRCGCFYGDGAAGNITEDDTLGVNFLVGALSGNQSINQGCCAAGNPRTLVGTDNPKWGYCTTS